MTDPAAEDRMLRLDAALDGELDAANAIAFERTLEGEPALAAEFRLRQATRDAIRRHAPREAAPPALAARIAAMTSAPAPRRGWSAAPGYALAASIAVAGFALGAGVTTLWPRSAAPRIEAGLVSDFARAAMAGQPFDVASSDRHTVKPWLAGRTTVSAGIVDLASAGFPLAGGRVAIVDKVPVPTLVYRHNEHLVAVTELAPSAPAGEAARETIDGYHVARWSDASLGYVAVSDMDDATLAAFVAAFRQARGATE